MTTAQIYYSYACSASEKKKQEHQVKQWEKDRKKFQEEKTLEGFIIVKRNGEKLFDYYPKSA